MTRITRQNPVTTKTTLQSAIATIPTTGGGGGSGVPLAMAKFRAVLAASQTTVGGVSKAAPIVYCGSSGTEGTTGVSNAAQRWPSRVTKALQQAYPLDSGDTPPTLVTSIPSLPLDPGVQGINLGLSGGTSAPGIGSTTGAVISLTPGNARYAKDIGALNPAAVFIQWPTNDVTYNVAASTTKANFSARLYDPTNGIFAGATKPPLIIFWRQYQRWDADSSVDYDDYLDAMNELAAADPDRIIVIDLVDDFAQIGIGNSSDRSNPLGFMYDVNVHLNAYGHAFQADLLLAKLGFAARSSSAISGDTTPPTAPVLSHGTVTSSSIQWTWTTSTDDTGVAGYRLKKVSDNSVAATITGGATSKTETGLTASTLQERYVTAFDGSGNESDPSNNDSATTSAGGGGYRAATDPALVIDVDPATLALSDGAAVSTMPCASALLSTSNATLSQASSGSQPAFKASAVNSLPAIVFAGGDRLLTPTWPNSYGPGSGATTPGPVTMFAVIKATSGDFCNGAGSGVFLTARKTASTTITVYAGNTTGVAATDTTAYEVVCIVWNGASTRIYVNDHDTYTTGTTSTAAAARLSGLRIGTNNSGSGNFLAGEIARMLIVNAGVSDADIATEMLALGTDYGITVS